MSDQKYPTCPKCGFMSLITEQTVERPDGENIQIRICMEKNCSTLWIPHYENDWYLILHNGKHQILAEEYRAKNAEAVEENNTVST